jgi:hypothetical protein
MTFNHSHFTYCSRATWSSVLFVFSLLGAITLQSCSPLRQVDRPRSSSIFVSCKPNPSRGLAQMIGHVLDAETHLPIAGASVVIDSTFFGASTDTSGFFSIEQIAPGMHMVSFLCIGSEPIRHHKILFSADSVVQANVLLLSVPMPGCILPVIRQ